MNDFKLEVNSSRSIKFLRGSLYPTQIGSSLIWQFPKMVTSQSVVLSFPETSVRETLSKTFVFMQFAVVLALIWLCVFSALHRIELKPYRLALSILGIGFGLAASAVLIGYVEPSLAILIGAFIACVTGVLALGIPFALPVILSSSSPLVFLSNGNAGLWLMLLAFIIISSLLPIETIKGFLLRAKNK